MHISGQGNWGQWGKHGSGGGLRGQAAGWTYFLLVLVLLPSELTPPMHRHTTLCSPAVTCCWDMSQHHEPGT